MEFLLPMVSDPIVNQNQNTMKTNFFLLTASLFIAATAAFAQNAAPFKWEAGAGIGALPTFAKDRPSSIVPPLSAYVSYRISGMLSIEGIGGYSASQVVRISSITEDPVQYDNRYQFAGMRLSVHTDPHRFEAWDIYGGMQGMMAMSRITQTPLAKSGIPTVTKNTKFYGTAYVGARYALNHNWGIWGELGLGAALGTVGMSFRLTEKGWKDR